MDLLFHPSAQSQYANLEFYSSFYECVWMLDRQRMQQDVKSAWSGQVG